MSAIIDANRLARPLNPFALAADDLERVEDILAETMVRYKHFTRLTQHLKHYRGKRLRPLLTILSGMACGRVGPEHHLLGAVVEMIHTATLVHDDVLDEAGIRRHVETVNARWGNRVSILLGDLLFTHAFHLTATLGDAKACEWIGEATNNVCAGELHQTMEQGNLYITEADYFDMIDGKTAALTEVACRLGAVYAGGDDFTADRLAEYGRQLGIAFQIADDLLDLSGDEDTVGKTLGTDLKQGKLTLPMIRLLNVLPADEAEAIRDELRAATPDFSRVLVALRTSGSLDFARNVACRAGERAAGALAILPPSQAKDVLVQLTAWAIRREK